MPAILIRNLDDETKRRLRTRAAGHGRSMEEEARVILRTALSGPRPAGNLADLALGLFGTTGVELPPHPAVRPRRAPNFDR